MHKHSIETRLMAFGDDWMEKYQYIMSLGERLPVLPEEYKTDEYKVDGCISQVWLKINVSDDAVLTFTGDSDSAIVKGLVAILRELLSERSGKEIVNEDVEGFFQRVGLEEHISMNRRNGFFSMVGNIKKAAAVLVH